jgi:hypothetical protein
MRRCKSTIGVSFLINELSQDFLSHGKEFMKKERRGASSR